MSGEKPSIQAEPSYDQSFYTGTAFGQDTYEGAPSKPAEPKAELVETPMPPVGEINPKDDSEKTPMPPIEKDDSEKIPMPPVGEINPKDDSEKTPMPPIEKDDTEKTPMPPVEVINPKDDSEKTPLPPIEKDDSEKTPLPPIEKDDTEKTPMPPVREKELEEEPERPEEKEPEDRFESLQKKIEAVRDRLDDIERNLIDSRAVKEKIDDKIEDLEYSIEKYDNIEEGLQERLSELNLEIKKTKRNIFNGFAKGLKLAKNLVLGKHDEVRELTKDINENVDVNEKAMEEHQEVSAKLDANNEERAGFDKEYADALDDRDATQGRILMLERQKAKALRQLRLLEEESMDVKWLGAWSDKEREIMDEMGADDLKTFRREQMADREELDDWLELHEKVSDKHMKPEDEEGKEIAEAVNEAIKDDHDSAVASIDANIEKVKPFAPTTSERIAEIKENGLVKGALSAMKRKILLRLQGLA